MSEDVFVISKIKNAIQWTYVINDLNAGEIVGRFYEKELQKTNQEEFRYQKESDNSFNSWIDKKDIEWNSLV